MGSGETFGASAMCIECKAGQSAVLHGWGDEVLGLGSHSCDPRKWIYTPVILGGKELDTLL